MNTSIDKRAARAAIIVVLVSVVFLLGFLALGFFVLTPMHDRYVQEHARTCEVQK